MGPLRDQSPLQRQVDPAEWEHQGSEQFVRPSRCSLERRVLEERLCLPRYLRVSRDEELEVKGLGHGTQKHQRSCVENDKHPLRSSCCETRGDGKPC